MNDHPEKNEGCPDAAALIEYAGGALPEVEEQKIRDHLSGCRTCRCRVGQWLDMRAEIESAETVLNSDTFVAAVMNKAERPARFRPREWLAQAAGLALVLFLFLLPRQSHDSVDVTALLFADQPDVGAMPDAYATPASNMKGGANE